LLGSSATIQYEENATHHWTKHICIYVYIHAYGCIYVHMGANMCICDNAYKQNLKVRIFGCDPHNQWGDLKVMYSGRGKGCLMYLKLFSFAF